jgi:hypothetical protein
MAREAQRKANMADDPKQTAEDRKRIDASQEHECRYWAEKFGVTPYQLKQAVQAAGPMVDDVARHLGKTT